MSIPFRLTPLAALIAVLAWAPLPLASNRPGSSALLSLLLFAVAALAAWQRDSVRWTPARATALALFGGALGWSLVQAAPGFGVALPHWEGIRALTGHPAWGSLSITPGATAEAALRLAGYGAAAWLGAAVLAGQHARHRVVQALALITGALAVYALIVQSTGSYTIWWWDKWIYQDVTTATFVNRNAYCVYAGVGVAAAMLAAETATRTHAKWMWRVLAGVGLLAAVLTESRWGLASVGAGLAVLVLLRPGPLPWRALGAGAVAVVLAPVALVLAGQGRFFARLDPQFVLGDLRWDIYRVTLEAISAAPWTGHGLGSYPVVYKHVRDTSLTDTLVFQAHSVPLELMAELGIPAALALMGAFVLLVAEAARHARRDGDPLARLAAAAGLMAGLHGLLDFSMQTPALAVTVLVLLGAGGTPTAPAPARSPARAAPGPPLGP
ncbi:O-antigen ligase [uncultured Rhodospira sp.]|uniref:O-antigen ligase family protein n=1 Tax=uncultured Rhodospira sp. TaxID=1936189 RepID=UPI0026221462|nr:O-antigen ligase family protein [uncultured Rhodospira sp.]